MYNNMPIYDYIAYLTGIASSNSSSDFFTVFLTGMNNEYRNLKLYQPLLPDIIIERTTTIGQLITAGCPYDLVFIIFDCIAARIMWYYNSPTGSSATNYINMYDKCFRKVVYFYEPSSP